MANLTRPAISPWYPASNVFVIVGRRAGMSEMGRGGSKPPLEFRVASTVPTAPAVGAVTVSIPANRLFKIVVTESHSWVASRARYAPGPPAAIGVNGDLIQGPPQSRSNVYPDSGTPSA